MLNVIFNMQEEEEDCATRTLPQKQESKELEVIYPWISLGLNCFALNLVHLSWGNNSKAALPKPHTYIVYSTFWK